MPIDLLEHLADADLPIAVRDPAQIHKLRALVAAGHIYATVPLPHFGLDGKWCQDAATVYFITALGYKVLRYFGPPEKAAALGKDRGS